ncbi:hypothetical protein [Nostoc sp. 106C]|nr:hypothetical protein [Nostoc sp. 106C]
MRLRLTVAHFYTEYTEGYASIGTGFSVAIAWFKSGSSNLGA